MTTRLVKNLVPIVVALAGLGACSDDRALDLDLLGGRQPDEQLDAERTRLRQLQLVRGFLREVNTCVDPSSAYVDNILGPGHTITQVVVNQPPVQTNPDLCEVTWHVDAPAERWANALQPACLLTSVSVEVGFCGLAEAARSICIAQQLRQFATDRAERFVSRPDVAISVGMGVQPAAGRAALLKEALLHAREASRLALDGIKAEQFEQVDINQTPCGTATQYSSTFVEAYHLYQEISEEAVDAVLAVSDAQRSWSSSVQQGVEWSVGGITDPIPEFGNLSRSEAAHLLVGGSPGLFLNNQAVPGFCTSAALSGQAQEAIRVFRQAALDPKAVLAIPNASWLTGAAVEIETLVNGTLTALSSGSVKERLKEKYPVLGTSDYADGVESFFKVEMADFVEARRYLAEEIRTFARSLNAVENPTTVTVCQPGMGTECGTQACIAIGKCWTDGTACTQPTDCTVGECIPGLCEELAHRKRYVATASEPEPLPPAYWTALAHKGGGTSWTFAPGYRPKLEEADNLGAFVDAAISEAQEIVKNPSFITDPVARDEVLNPLSLLVSEGATHRRGRMLYSQIPEDPIAAVTVFGYAVADNLRLVVGEDALRCALTGMVEGAQCEQVGGTLMVNNLGSWLDFDKSVGVALNPAPTGGERWYVVRPKDPADASPGTFEVLGGGTFEGLDKVIPIIPSATERTAEVLQPSRKWCTQQKVSCAGTDFDERMPLENELTSDGDTVESSWRHYLTLARQAADESDALGDTYFNAGIEDLSRTEQISIREEEQRLRAESELEVLQDICGTSIDATRLMELIGEDLSEIRSTTVCPTNPCAEGEVCLVSTCIKDPALLAEAHPDDPDLSRLAECIGLGTDVAYVTSGNVPLCFFLDNGNPTRPCHGATTACPTLPVDAALLGTTDSLSWAPEDREASIADVKQKCSTLEVPDEMEDTVEVAVPLGYFDSLVRPVPVSQKDLACDAIRRLRWGIANNADANFRRPLIDLIIGANIFNEGDLKNIASRVGWSPEVTGGSRVTFDGGLKFGTYSLSAFNWPCGLVCPQQRDGLMCFDCAADTLPLDLRLANAVMALRLGAWWDGDDFDPGGLGVTVPLYFRPSELTSFAINEIVGAQTLSSGRVEWDLGVAPNGVPNVCTTVAGGAFVCSDFTDHISAYSPLSGNPDEVWGGWASVSTDGLGHFALGENMARVSTAEVDRANLFGGLDEIHYANDQTHGWLRKVYEGTQDPESGLPYYFAKDPAEGGYAAGIADSVILDERSSPFSAGAGHFYESLLSAEEVLTPASVLDAAELFCELSDQTRQHCDLLNPPTIQSIEQLEDAKLHLGCMADQMQANAAHAIFANMPERAIQALRSMGGTGAYPAVGGELGAAISRLRAELVHIAEIVPMAAHEVRAMGDEIAAFGLFVRGNELSHDLVDLNRLSAEMAETARCDAADSKTYSHTEGSSMGGGVSLFPPSVSVNVSLNWSDGTSWNPGAAAATCANTASQIRFGLDRTVLEHAQLTNSEATQLNGFQQSFENRTVTLYGYAQDLKKSAEEIDAKLAEIESLRKKAQRTLYRALFMSSFQAEGQEELSTAMRARKDITKVRYDRAFQNAQRMAFLAKRAIEQRIGFHLSEMRSDLPLVEAPSKWESEICATTGLNFDDIEASEEGDAQRFADQYIGEYVTKLENLIESYQLTYNFHEGADTAVISLRDDIQNRRAECELPIGNLLYHSAELARIVPADSENVGWRLANCAEQPVAPGSPVEGFATTEPIPNCIDLMAPDLSGDPEATGDDFEAASTPFLDGDFGALKMYELEFGLNGTPCTGTECGYRSDSYLYQDVELGAGTYRLSWFGLTELSGGTFTNGNDLVRAVEADPAMAGTLPASPTVSSLAVGDIWRSFYTFSIDEALVVRVKIAKPATGVAWRVGGIMLEDISETLTSELAAFAATGESLTRIQPVCEDTTGEVFRAEGWTRGCARLCANGFEGECTGSNAETHCYWETAFNVNQRSIEANGQLIASGFARGNFNYRIAEIGVNFVGTGTRNCEASETPSTCYAAAFIPYSLKHEGPYFVRNHIGQQFEAALFTGNIEHARGLAGERYLTNPLSDADQTLIADYMRQELAGRPIDGNFKLRVWEEPGVDFDAIRDAQIVLKYRYWTRFD